jgi:hypothetical protein
MIAPSPRAQHFEVRIMGLSDMTLKKRSSISQEVWHMKEPSLPKAISAKHRSIFTAPLPVIVTAVR